MPSRGVLQANSDDPTSPEFGLHAPKGWAELPIPYKIDTNMTVTQLQALRAAITTWETAVGRRLFDFGGKHSGVTGDSFPDLFSSLRDGLNGHYNDANWKKTGKTEVILATTIWNNPGNTYYSIDAADIRYNSEVYYISDALQDKPVDQREIVDMQSLATHELGHLLGLAHVEEDHDPSSIMNPSIFIGQGIATRSLSLGDIQRIQKIYGCQGSSCDVVATARYIMQTRNEVESDTVDEDNGSSNTGEPSH
jgi:hypothetical protein